MNLANVTHIVFYRPYRVPSTNPLECAMFSDTRDAMSFESSHRRYCSTMSLCKVDFKLTEDIITQICNSSMHKEIVL